MKNIKLYIIVLLVIFLSSCQKNLNVNTEKISDEGYKKMTEGIAYPMQVNCNQIDMDNDKFTSEDICKESCQDYCNSRNQKLEKIQFQARESACNLCICTCVP